MNLHAYLGVTPHIKKHTRKIDTIRDDVRLRCEGPLIIDKQEQEKHILTKMSIQSYQGQRHYYSLPVRGQRSRNSYPHRLRRPILFSKGRGKDRTSYRRKK